MPKEKQVLGKGLDVLFSQSSRVLSDTSGSKHETVTGRREDESILFIEINKITTNPYQPREEFEEAALNELAESIKQKGVIQAITVRKIDTNHYELLSGERRLRAAKIAGINKVPAFVMDVSSKEDLLEISLIENIQRKDLNALEVAQGYQRLIEECKLTQEQVASKVAKSRSAVTNFLRLLKLPEQIKQSIRKNEITEGHARAILALETDAEQIHLWKRIVGENLSVRKTEEFTKNIRKKREKKVFEVTNQDKAAVNFLENKFREHFGTKVKLLPKTKTSGEIIIEYYTSEDLERIIDLCKKK
jgi:ParB family chromosome partitioning protein